MPLPLAQIKLTSWGPDVYPPSDDTFALADALRRVAPALPARPPHLCVELGSGSGYLAASLALILDHLNLPCQVVAIDASPAAAAATRTTLLNHGVGWVDVIVADFFEGISVKNAVDLLLFNPPYVPTPEEEVGRGGISAAWAGGPNGRMVIDRLLPVVASVLAPGGRLLMVTVAENDPGGVVARLRDHGLEAGVVLERAADEEALRIVSATKPLVGVGFGP